MYKSEKRMTVSSKSWRQMFKDNEVVEDRARDRLTSSSTTWRTCGSRWRTQGILMNGEVEPVWLTPHPRDSQPEGARKRERERFPYGNILGCINPDSTTADAYD